MISGPDGTWLEELVVRLRRLGVTRLVYEGLEIELGPLPAIPHAAEAPAKPPEPEPLGDDGLTKTEAALLYSSSR